MWWPSLKLAKDLAINIIAAICINFGSFQLLGTAFISGFYAYACLTRHPFQDSIDRVCVFLPSTPQGLLLGPGDFLPESPGASLSNFWSGKDCLNNGLEIWCSLSVMILCLFTAGAESFFQPAAGEGGT